MKKAMAIGMSVVLLGFLGVSLSHGANTIKVGFVDTYSGAPSVYCFDVVDAFKMAIEAINAKGGVLGKKIEYTTRDEKFDPATGLSMAKELVMKEEVDILAGTINSATTLAVSDFARKEKIPFICTFAKSEKITGEMGHRYVFAVSENTRMIGKATAFAIAKKPYTKFWMAGEDYEYGHAVNDAAWRYTKAMKPTAQLLGQTWWKVGEADIAPYVAPILQAKPDCLFMGTGGSGNLNFLKLVKSMDLAKQLTIILHTSIELSNLQALGQDGPEGVWGTVNYLFYYPETKENKAFVEEFRKMYNRPPKVGALYGYAAAQLIVKAYQKAGKIDKEAFINAMEGLTVDTPVGKLEMRKCDHQLMLPMFFGVTKKSPQYEYLIGSNLITIPGKDYLPTCDEILKVRK
ncbi:MAG TPA: ABC transporter substrate-binding protein [Thermodesulfobacteriota bacterium]|nr:ABC transporter substrate-binding protein [Thermodesulfobacteriota bacterium]